MTGAILQYERETFEEEGYSQESPNIEKLDEMPDYETMNWVVAKDTRIPSNDKHSLIHPDSLIKTKSGLER